MTADKKDSKSDKKEFSFIQEHIMPKKKSRLKKLICVTAATIVLAVIFGLVARIVFCTSESLFDRFFGKADKKESVTFPETDVSQNAEDIQDKEKEKEPEKKEENIIIEKSVDADISDYTMMYSQINDVADGVNDSMVTVTSVASGVDWFNKDYEIKSITSGLILKNSGSKLYILVSYRKMQDANNIRVTFVSGLTVDAEIMDYDSDIDIAVLAVPVVEIPADILSDIKPAVLGESFLLQTGDPVMALGSPNGYTGSIELGMITNKANPIYTVDNKLELFNTDINDNPNGDGVITNLRGEVVGIITQKFKSDFNENINTVLSISKIKPVLEKMMNEEPMSYLGIIGADMTPEIAKNYDLTYGVYITQVKPKSPAFKAGMKSGDVILSIEDMKIMSMASLHTALAGYVPGDTVEITVKNTTRPDSRQNTMKVTLGRKR